MQSLRTLILLRGAPGCGKTTWIESNGLKSYSLSADDIRTMYSSSLLGIDGTYYVSQMNDRAVWKLLFEVLESRMANGELTVIDATNSKTVEMNRYKSLAKTYRYRIFCIDFTDIPIDVCKMQNRMRPEHKVVPENVIDNMYARFATQKIPSGITVLKPDQLDNVWFKPIDLSMYRKIHHIGDIHGCYTALHQYMGDHIHEDEFYIFCGDYIDRGLENAQVVKYLCSIRDLPNVLLLEGNHERWLWSWSHGKKSQSTEFEKYTKAELESEGIDPKEVRNLYRKLGQCAYYHYNEKTVLVTHGGLSCIPSDLTKAPTEQMIKGVGRYSEYELVAENFDRSTPDNVYQIFGHRNTKNSPIRCTKRCFNLEGAVEFGGALRVVELDAAGFHTYEVNNEVYRRQENVQAAVEDQSVSELATQMRASRYINEKKFGDISSFNFTRDAFYDRHWTELTTKARGLFINTKSNAVVARAYDKFFNLNERQETKEETLRSSMVYPVVAYCKENGFLGIVSYDDTTDELFIASKSSPHSPYAGYLKEIFYNHTKDPDAVKEYVKSNNVSLVFECIDPVRDPHIIKYEKQNIILLDIVSNQIRFEKMPYDTVCLVGRQYGWDVKRKAYEFTSCAELYDWIAEVKREDYLFDGKEIEGFVLEDTNGSMINVKLFYYNTWKFLRGVVETVNKVGYYRNTAALNTPLQNLFYGWYRDHVSDIDMPSDIISIRELFYREMAKKGAMMC